MFVAGGNMERVHCHTEEEREKSTSVYGRRPHRACSAQVDPG